MLSKLPRWIEYGAFTLALLAGSVNAVGLLGSAQRGEVFDKRKAMLFLLIISGFILGGFAGGLLYVKFAFIALIAPAIICFLLALAYKIYSARKR